ncbi:hypothetical protein BH10BAC2_BH10BAC2_23390 [soil metagenome]
MVALIIIAALIIFLVMRKSTANRNQHKLDRIREKQEELIDMLRNKTN